MLVHPRYSLRLIFALIAVAGVADVRAQLVTTSPFLAPQASGAAAGPTVGAPLENRGSIDTPGEGLKVRISDPNRKIGAWLRVNEHDPNYDFVVKQYDTSRDTATVEYGGRTLILPLREAKVTSSGMAPAVPIAQMPSSAMGALPAGAGATPASQTQLEAVAAAVAQRRALREQAAQPVNQGVPAPPQLPQTPPQNQNQGGQPRGPRGGVNGTSGATGPAGRRGA
jgi:hypothetical protein